MQRLHGGPRAAVSTRCRATNSPFTVRAGLKRGRLCVQARAPEVGVGIFGTKAGMLSFFTPEGLAVPATVIKIEDGNLITQIKTAETDGYNAVQVGYQVVPDRKITKPEIGHLKKASCPPLRRLREFRFHKQEQAEAHQPGQTLKIEDLFEAGALVDIAGTSIGKGFQGGVKRWNLKRGLMTHGSKSHREHGTTGPGTTPGRVFPGLKAAGQMGNQRVKCRKVKVLKVDVEKQAIVVKGGIPGKAGNVVEITPAKIVGKNVR